MPDQAGTLFHPGDDVYPATQADAEVLSRGWHRTVKMGTRFKVFAVVLSGIDHEGRETSGYILRHVYTNRVRPLVWDRERFRSANEPTAAPVPASVG